MLCAHINPITLKEQSVKEHLDNVSKMSMEYGAKISLEATGELIGILHDMGKETNKFDKYIHYCSSHPSDKSLRGTINHSTAGAKFIYDNFYNTTDIFQKFTAQLISLAICSHHGGLIDCLDLKGIDIFTNKMETDKDILYDEALRNFKSEYSGIEHIKDLFNKSKNEIKIIFININKINETAKFGQFAAGMLEKYLFSCVIDADRYDTYTFMEGKDWKKSIDKSALWNELADKLETKLESYPKLTKIDLLREEVSISCKNFAGNKPGIYQLAVPTGGGKTLSSLRYALGHAKKFNKDRIFYIIPFTTIIDQNAKDIKDILCRDDIILEHHSNLVVDNQQEDYKLLTERWDSPIVLTTMVQFLDTLFSGGTQGVRRMHNLANSIIIFDEIQAIPIKCINMFNSAINFLANICNATIILCTATQPLLSTTKMPLMLSENANIITDIHEKFKQFKRVNLLDKRIVGGYSVSTLKDFILKIMEKLDNASEIKDKLASVLAIFNTKNAAKEVFNELKKANVDLPKEKQYLIFHLSTNMCPSHRMKILKDIREKLGHQRIICISTQLIEAGVNISFGCVVRSLAGLDSIAQAAGRCNRHGESSCSDVYIVNVEGENVSKLVDIKEGQECTKRVLDEFKENPNIFDNDLLSPKTMERYYKYYYYNRSAEMDYALRKPDDDKSMYDLLAANNEGGNEFNSRNGFKSKLMLKQGFKTAGNNFQVIDQNTTGVIVPYGEGEELISLINGQCSLGELKQYLRKAQQFSVNIYETDKRKLEQLGGLIGLKDNAIIALRKEFYTEDAGVTFENAPMEFCNF
ncbi:CRISPR-associated helicase Cas3' [Clostridium estertheticum]|uniref:CRISPR-associated helicase Cas3' n=1 Tax=Clostridium estertheticum TaxID=238834 RepID=UPI001C7E0355|nr:CRISPR-associated helicase Cas3' [Clostridium estertheticum]MBX4261559.1 CRISPR-associated helicase Cas3' [Clostridium estertheticum]WLC70941.1 CRISPR-associated helicase Cas3' [Clostridium estertheticum]